MAITMDEGMEALLDFDEFGKEAELPAESSESLIEKPILPLDQPEPSVSRDVTDSSSTAPDSEIVVSTEDCAPKKKRKHNSGNSMSSSEQNQSSGTESAKEKSRKLKVEDDGASTSRETNPDEDDLEGLLDGEDFEGDLLDLLPLLKEEDPEDVAERQKLQLLISHLSEEQLNRYEVYRRASFPKASVRRIVQTVGGCTVSQNAVIAMAGIAKMHVGEIVETALDVKEEWGESGPVQPKHLREATRRLRNKATTTPSKYRKKTQTLPYP
jgi:transcription initiation factor TFIID subunit 11